VIAFAFYTQVAAANSMIEMSEGKLEHLQSVFSWFEDIQTKPQSALKVFPSKLQIVYKTFLDSKVFIIPHSAAKKY
jgi:hypothetical protein